MKKVIWKFETSITDKFSIDMPLGSEILCVQFNETTNLPCIWALVNPTNETELRYFELYGTGHDIHYDMGVVRKYIGTYQCDGGIFIGHLFERID